jgi:hypothetical protein
MCGCAKKSRSGVKRSSIPTNSSPVSSPPSNNLNFAGFAEKSDFTPGVMTDGKKRILKLRRDAIRKSLGK